MSSEVKTIGLGRSGSTPAAEAPGARSAAKARRRRQRERNVVSILRVCVIILLLTVGGIVLLVFLFVIGQYFNLWLQALLSGARVRLIDLIMMRIRKVRPQEIVYNRISAKKAGLDIPTDYLESHYLAGGRVTNVVRAMIAADKAKIELTLYFRNSVLSGKASAALKAVLSGIPTKRDGSPFEFAFNMRGRGAAVVIGADVSGLRPWVSTIFPGQPEPSSAAAKTSVEITTTTAP